VTAQTSAVCVPRSTIPPVVLSSSASSFISSTAAPLFSSAIMATGSLSSTAQGYSFSSTAGILSSTGNAYASSTGPAPTYPVDTVTYRCGNITSATNKTAQYGCPVNECCSSYGFCGTNTTFCGTGCQSNYGQCGNNAAPTYNVTGPFPQDIVTGRCGPINNGSNILFYSCSPGQCCSAFGFCGSAISYCSAGCQTQFGACGNINGTTTTTTTNGTTVTTGFITIGGVQVSGATVFSDCTSPDMLALTFDDGPWSFTPELITYLITNNIAATLFVNGNNWDCIYNAQYVTAYRQALAAGIQFGVHTWNHVDLQTQSYEQTVTQMQDTENALFKILGIRPSWMRPPFGSYNSTTVGILSSIGYTRIAMWEFGGGDSEGQTVAQSEAAYTAYYAATPQGSPIVLQHDPYQSTVEQIVPWVVNYAKTNGKRIVTVGECVGDDPSNWYRGGIQTPAAQDATWVCTS
jgi:peptidoglycan/xylan/chitin deacetylase (PgdA/CDA1 family)